MQAQQVVAALQRIAAVAVEVEPRAPGDQNALAARPAVERPLEKAAPGPVLVNLVEDPQAPGGQFAPQDPLAVRGDVPVEIARGGAGQGSRKRGLADLARPGDERHLARQVAPQLGQKIAGGPGHADNVP